MLNGTSGEDDGRALSALCAMFGLELIDPLTSRRSESTDEFSPFRE